MNLKKFLLLALVSVAYLLAGSYPINPLPRFDNSGATLTPEALRFEAPGIAYTPQPPAWLNEVIAGQPLEILLELRTADRRQGGPARILTVSANTGQRNLTIGQSGDDLIIRLRRSEETFNGTPAYVLPGVFNSTAIQHIHLALKGKLLTVTVNGVQRLREPLPHDALKSWAPGHRLALGNEITFDRPWLGVIRQAFVRVNGETYDYLDRGALKIPTTYFFRDTPRTLQLIPFHHSKPGALGWLDWISNYLGFIPIGVLITLLFPMRRPLLLSTGLCLILSLTMEFIQLFLPWRFPSVNDLVLNTLGGLTGGWLGLKYGAHIKAKRNTVSHAAPVTEKDARG